VVKKILGFFRKHTKTIGIASIIFIITSFIYALIYHNYLRSKSVQALFLNLSLFALPLSFIYLAIKEFILEKKITVVDFIIIMAIFAFIFSFPITYSILLFGKDLASYDGVRIGSADAWIGFIGTMISMAIATTAISFTIKSNQKKDNFCMTRYDEIEKLKELLDKKAITQRDYDKKKKELLFKEEKKNW